MSRRTLDCQECYDAHRRIVREFWPDYGDYVRCMAGLTARRRWRVMRNRFPYDLATTRQLVLWSSAERDFPESLEAAFRAHAGHTPERVFSNPPQLRSVPQVPHVHAHTPACI